jgi:hypothetical protein
MLQAFYHKSNPLNPWDFLEDRNKNKPHASPTATRRSLSLMDGCTTSGLVREFARSGSEWALDFDRGNYYLADRIISAAKEMHIW